MTIRRIIQVLSGFVVAGVIAWLVAYLLDPFAEISLRIDEPKDGAFVGEKETAKGTTPHDGMNHYLLVVPMEAGTAFVQEPLVVLGDGSWSGRAQFGEGKLGCDEAFLLSVIATRETLIVGPAEEIQPDWPTSPQIKVRRMSC